MPEKWWKRVERKVAEFFTTKRTPLSGGASRITRSDTIHERLFIETKGSKKHSVITLWDKTAAMARKEKKIPVVALCEKGRPGFWLMVKAEDLIDVAMEAKLDTDGHLVKARWIREGLPEVK